ncbi:MAG: hypothetical protein WDZ49_10325 [Litorilinea sp.]
MTQTLTTEERRKQRGSVRALANVSSARGETAEAAPAFAPLDGSSIQRLLGDPMNAPQPLLPDDVRQLANTVGNRATQDILSRRSPQQSTSHAKNPSPRSAPNGTPGTRIQRSPLARITGGIVQRGPLDWYRRRKNKNKNKNRLGDDAIVPNSMQQLGAHSANEVFKVKTNQNIGSSKTNEGFFKPDNDEDWGMDDGLGQSDRAVASSILNKYLGFNNIAENVYADLNGQRGAISAKVPGMPLMETLTDDRGAMSGFRYNSPNLENPNTQKGLMDLQLFDLIKGEGDRHGGNIYVDPASGQVHGIDEDFSFGHDMGVYKRERDAAPGSSDPDMKYSTMPMLFDEGTAKRILGKKAKNLPKMLKGHLTDDEIKTAQERLRYVKAHLRDQKKQGRLVKKWDKDTYNQVMSQDGKKGMYDRRNQQQLYYYYSYLRRQEGLRDTANPNDDEVPEAIGPEGSMWEENALFG